MAENRISKIKLPNGNTYQIYDSGAARKSDITTVFRYMGTKPTEAEIWAITKAAVGDVYIATKTNTEWVCKETISDTAKKDAWEEFGPVIDAASSNHTHSVTVNRVGNATASHLTAKGNVIEGASPITKVTLVGEQKGELPTFAEGAFTPNKPTVINTAKFNGGDVTAPTGAAIISVSGGTSSLTDAYHADTLTLDLGINTVGVSSTTGNFVTSVTHTPAQFTEGFYTAGSAASKAKDTWTAGKLPNGTTTTETGAATKVTLPTFTEVVNLWQGDTASGSTGVPTN